MALADDLISAWELNGDFLDSHGSNDLTNSGAGSGTGLIYPSAADFEASDPDYASHASNASLQTGNIGFTFEVWFKAETTFGCLVAKDVDTSREYTFDFDGGGAPRWYLNGSIAVATWGSAVSTGTWYQAIVWHDPDLDVTGITINDGTPVTADTFDTAPNTGAAQFRIGAREYPSFEDYFDGLIGPVRFWKRVLTSGEITELYNGGAGRTYAYINPVGVGIPIAMRHYLRMMGVG